MRARGSAGPRVAAGWLAGLLVAGALAAATAPRNVRFDHLTVDDGLSQGIVNCILQDRRGLMWFGTQDGLNRFDGYTVRVFRHDEQDPASLPDNTVWTLHEAADGALWVGTENGLARFDPQAESFQVFRSDPQNPTSLSNNRVRVLFADADGSLWVGTDGGGINRFDPDTRNFRRYLANPSNPRSLSDDRVRSISADADGMLWIATDGGGVDRFDRGKETFTHFRHDPDDPRSLSDDRVHDVLVDRAGAVWIGTSFGGLNRLDRATGTITRFPDADSSPLGISGGRVLSLYEDPAGTVWIGTDGGLHEWSPEARGFLRYTSSPADESSLNDNRVTAILEDSGSVLWVGTQGSGLNRWNTATQAFGQLRKDPTRPGSLSSNTVTAFAEGPRDVIWVGTYEGLDRFERRTGRVRAYRHDAGDRGSLSDDRVMSLLVDRAGYLWVGTLGGGLNRLAPDGERFTRFTHDPGDPRSLSGNGVTTIFQDSQGQIWVGVYRGGLNRFDPATQGFLHYRADPGSAAGLSDDKVLTIAEGRGGVLWIGTESGGLNRFDTASGSFSSYRHDPGDPASLSSDSVFALHLADDGTLWIGTQGGGLNRWSLDERQRHLASFRQYSTRDGLPNDTVYGILEDASGNLWMSTNRGLSRFDPRGETFRNFAAVDGLQSYEFNFGASLRSASGELYFGGNNGFNYFSPQSVGTLRPAPRLVITGFSKLGDSRAPAGHVEDGGLVELSHRDYVVSFEFAALDYAAPTRNQYAYRLEGTGEGWVSLGTDRRVTFSRLPAGRYTLRVKASNSDGTWNEQGISVRIHVAPPPWRTWWAYAAYAAILLGVLTVVATGQQRRLDERAARARELEELVQMRTAELARRNEELERANLKLESASLTDPLTGLHNRRFLMDNIQRDVALAERHYRGGGGSAVETPDSPQLVPDFAVLMIDLDGLKALNDGYGHGAGDLVLLQLREVLESACRRSDTIHRWGGDEFLVVARHANREVAQSLADRILHGVRSHEFDVGFDRKLRLTCSIGFAFFPFVAEEPGRVSWEQVITIADRALYIAKASGRDAWVGIFSTDRNPPVDFVARINHRPEDLADEGVIRVRTSLGPKALVYGRRGT